MRSESYRLRDLDKVTIPIGFVGENLYTTVKIDCESVFSEHPNAVPALAVTPPEGESYPAVVTREGDIVIWRVSASDLIHKGTGEIQLSFTIDGEIIGMTYPANTRVFRSIIPTGETPTPIANWLTEAGQTLGELQQAVPDGGTTGQVLAKKSNADRDTEWVDQTGGGGGTSNYNNLTNKPQIAGVTLQGNKTLHELGIASESDIPDVSGFYTKPQTGIPSTDLSEAVQTSLGKADSAYKKPSDGIPATDLKEGVIPSVPVKDVQFNGTSILDENGNANIPYGNNQRVGVVKIDPSYGLQKFNEQGLIAINPSNVDAIKGGEVGYRPICPERQHAATFYGLAKAAGADMKNSSNAIGVYTDEAKLKIQQMLGLWTPKFYSKITLEEDNGEFGRYGNNFEDPTIEVWEELVIVLYQSIGANGQTIATNNWGTFYLRDAINDTYLTNAGYIYGAAPVTICFRRYPNVLMVETTTNANTQVISRSYPRLDDYVDKVRYLWLHCEGGSVKEGTTMEAYIHRFI